VEISRSPADKATIGARTLNPRLCHKVDGSTAEFRGSLKRGVDPAPLKMHVCHLLPSEHYLKRVPIPLGYSNYILVKERLSLEHTICEYMEHLTSELRRVIS
jgi:hypothetical protein